MVEQLSPGAVIIGGTFNSLGAARSLANNGVSVYVIDAGWCIAQFSRHIRRFFRGPPTSDDAELVDFLLRLAQEANLIGCVLFPERRRMCEDIRATSRMLK